MTAQGASGWPISTTEQVQGWLIERLSERLGISPAAVDIHEPLSRYGLDSGGATGLLAELSVAVGLQLSPTLVWRYPTIEALARCVTTGVSVAPARPSWPFLCPIGQSSDGLRDEPIALIGVACRLPGAPDPGAFWRLLRDGVDAIAEVPRDRWDIDTFYAADGSIPGKMSTRWGGFLERVDQFDPQFFDISPREAVTMDPQQRLMLELSWEALEDAGVPPRGLKGSRAGVFFGAMWNDYARGPGGDPELIVQHTATGHDLSIIPARVSYTLGLQGPSILVSTACSSSLVAVHLACQSLLRGESQIVLAGGVTLILSPEGMIAMSKFGAMAPDGRSKTFDATADGYVRGEGGGVVVLKRLSRALADGDPIYCVIRGSAVNNDGFSNGLSAPNPKAQEAVLREACARAGVLPAEVQYVEAHGTGTLLGDPIEAKALGAVLCVGRRSESPLLLGSVKSNIGHLEPAAGITGLIKVALAMRHAALPASLHVQTLNPHIPFDLLGMRVQRTFEAWPEHEKGRMLAGVSSFGFGGTNCHAVVEGVRPSLAHLLPLSAASAEGLAALARDLLSWRMSADETMPPLPALCSLAAAQLTHHGHRLALTVSSSEELDVLLEGFLEGRRLPGVSSGRAGGRRPRIVFMFGGQGSQWPGMGQDLLREEPAFRAALMRCDAAVRACVGWSLLDVLTTQAAGSLDAPEVVQPAIFAVQVALAALWRSWGVEPSAVVGQSIGEVAAAHVAGALSLEDAVLVICRMGQVASRVNGAGGAAVVDLSMAEAQSAVSEYGERLCVSGSSSPKSSVLSGDPEALDELIAKLQETGVLGRRVKMSYAPHGPQMDAMRSGLWSALKEVRPEAGAVPFYSTLTGALCDGVGLDAMYWVQNLRQPVLFSSAIERLIEEQYDVFLEVDPHPVLVHAVEQCLSHVQRSGLVLPSLRREQSGRAILLASLGALYTRGQPVSWHRLFPIEPRDAPLQAPGELGSSLLGVLAAGSAARGISLPDQLLVLSARSAKALGEVARSMSSRLREGDGDLLADVCYTASVRRSHHEHRLAVVGRFREDFCVTLDALARGEPGAGVVQGQVRSGLRPKVVFVFPGQGSQWAGMGRELLETEPAFRRALMACDDLVRQQAGWSLIEELLMPDASSRLGETEIAQPALLAIEVALAELLRSWSVVPDAVIGHSVGEVAAAHVAGVLSLAEAVRLVVLRGRVMQKAAGQGKMVSVALSSEGARDAIAGREDRIGIAAINDPASVVLAGGVLAMDALVEELSAGGVRSRSLPVNYAFHSPAMERLREEFVTALGPVAPCPATTPMYSTVTGGRVLGESMDAAYWGRNLRHTVQLAAAVEAAFGEGQRLFVEVGPHPVLASSIEGCLSACGGEGRAVITLRRQREERQSLLGSLGMLFARGVTVDFARLYPDGGRVVALPLYPWQRQRYWVEAVSAQGGAVRGRGARLPRAGGHPLLGVSFTSSIHAGARFWETELGPESVPRLSEQRVHDELVVPPAAYLEMVLAAARESFSGGSLWVEDVAFGEALVLREGKGRTVQLALVEQGTGWMSFRLASREEDAQGGRAPTWIQRAAGTVRVDPTGPSAAAPPDEPLTAIQARCGEEVSRESHHQEMTDCGLIHGPAFQGVQQLWRGAREALARLRMDEADAGQAQSYQLHPALLDAGLQVLMGALAGGKGEVSPGALALTHLRGFRVHARPGVEVWGHARLRGGQQGSAELEGDTVLMDATGRVLVEMIGLRMKPIERTARHHRVEEDQRLLAVRWERADAREAPATSLQAPRGRWLMLGKEGGEGGIADAVQALLQARGEPVVRVVEAGTTQPVQPGWHRVDPSQPEAWDALLRQASADGAPCRGILLLSCPEPASADDSSPGSLQAVELQACGSVLHLVQSLSRVGWREMPRLWLCTRGVQAAGAERASVAVVQASLWGLGRTLAYEHPELRCTRVDLGPSGAPGEAAALVRELLSEPAEQEIALRPEGRYVSRLMPWAPVTAAGEAVIPAEDRAFRLEMGTPGDLDGLSLRAAPRRPPGPGEVEIQVEVAGLNFIDVMKARGEYPGLPDGPVSLGLECAGRVEALGEGVEGFQVGQEVVAFAPSCLSSRVTTSAASVIARPQALSLEQAASVPVAFMTAWYSLYHVGRLQRGERILIHSAAGGTGLAAVQLARRVGAEVFATAGTEEKRSYLREIGVGHVMDSRSLSFVEAVMKATDGKGVDVVVNSLSGEFVEKSLAVLAMDGRFLELGRRDIHASCRSLSLESFRRRLSYSAIDLLGFAEQRPDRLRLLFEEVMGAFARREIEPSPVQVVAVSRAADAFRALAQGRHVGKFVISLDDPQARVVAPAREEGRFRVDGSYLITGGLGGLGLSVARWMVEQGARSLTLMGRRGAETSAQEQAIAALRSRGAEVTVARADVSDRAQLAGVLREIEERSPPLRGVIHTAGVLEDGVILRQSPERFQKAMSPKVLGACNLHALTQEMPLDFFVLYSSVTSILGSPGQGNYAAANTFLDALAHHRRGRGLPALSVNWGPFSEVGLAAAQANRGERLAQRGMGALTPEEGTAILGRLLDEDATQVAVVSLDVRQWVEFYPQVAGASLLSSLVLVQGSLRPTRPEEGKGAAFHETLRASAPEERLARLEQFIREQVGHVIKLELSCIERDTPLKSLGVDSLLGIELRNRLEAGLGMTLPATLIWAYPHVASLAEHVGRKMGLDVEAVHKPSAPTQSEASAAILAEIERLSEDELADELEKELGLD